MPKKRIFISFDYDHDKNYRYLLTALSENAGSDISFDDSTPGEIDTDDVSRIKAALTCKIREATHTLVIVGKHANTYHEDREEIGTRNWQWWEIEKSAEEGKGLIAVKIESSNSSPDPLYGKGATWAKAFKVASILAAIEDA